MEATIQLYTTDGESKKGFPVKLVLYNGKRKRKTIGNSILEHWNEATQLPRPAHPRFEQLSEMILSMRAVAVTSKFKRIERLDQALDFLQNTEGGGANNSVYGYCDVLTKRMRASGRDGNALFYEGVMQQFKYFSHELFFDDITPDFIERFKMYKLDGCTNKTVKEYVGCLRAVYNKAVRDPDMLIKDKTPFENATRDLPTRRRRKKNRYLDPEGIKQLQALTGLSPRRTMVVDLTLLQFYLGGVDLFDLYYLKRKQLYGNRVMFQRGKLGKLKIEFDVRVFEPARKILEKYMASEGEYVFPWKKPHKSYITWRGQHNKWLIKVQQKHGIALSPIDANLTSKVMRHSFRTRAKFLHIEVDMIRELMGHERDDVDTAYADKFSEKERDAAQKLIINLDD